jgi:hypothetical protein
MTDEVKQSSPSEDSKQKEQLNSDEKTVFEKARLEHCIRLFKEENSRREGFEKTAQFYLTFITAFLGALFLKIDALETLSKLLTNKKPPVLISWIVYASIISMLLSLLLALVSILACIRVRRYKREFPANPALRLFSTDSLYTGGEDNKEFIKITAMTYIAAIEANFHITEWKGLWIERASLFVLSSVISLFIFLSSVTYLMLH